MVPFHLRLLTALYDGGGGATARDFESEIRHQLVPNERWSDISEWWDQLAVLAWLRRTYLLLHYSASRVDVGVRWVEGGRVRGRAGGSRQPSVG